MHGLPVRVLGGSEPGEDMGGIEGLSGTVMGWAVQTTGPAPDPATGVLTVRALHRLPSDVVAELMEV
jgi:hypothetical protein